MLLEVRGLTKEYKRASKAFAAVNNVDLSIEHKDFVSIIGKSGSGKSTLLNMLAGLLTQTSGSVVLDDQDISKLNDYEISYLRNKKIGYIAQGQSLLPSLTVLDNVLLPFHMFETNGDATDRAKQLLDGVGLSDFYNVFPAQLSGGEQRRVAIARAMINSPVILIADEPTSNLDSKTSKEIMELFSQIAEKGTVVLLVTHDLDIVKYGNRVLVMEDGLLNESKSILEHSISDKKTKE
jgi:putative ABC transport system ATP-binding protein